MRPISLSRYLAVLLLIILGWLQLSTLDVTAATFDEPMHITRGYIFVARGIDRVPKLCSPCSPVLGTALMGVSLSLEPRLQLPPVDDPIWREPDTGLIEKFMWSNAVSPQEIIFLARLPIMFVSWLLGALIFRWAKQRSGDRAAVAALALYVFCPNLLAHGHLATTDVVTAATFALSAYAFDRALHRSSWWLRVFSGVAFGLALAAKFSSAMLAIAFVIMLAAHLWINRREGRSVRQPIVTLLITFSIGGLTLWAIYRFSIGPIDPGGLSLPAPAYWAEWQALNDYILNPTPGYLFGQVSAHGWWYYYPITFLVKTPLPILIALVAGIIYVIRSRAWLRALSITLPPILLMGSLLLSPHDLGYRYLLPLLPFVFVLSGDLFAWLKSRGARVAFVGLIAWQVIGTLRVYPYTLTYFNDLIGSPEIGRYILSDSNIDWGQDLVGLKNYVDQHHIQHLKFSYFGATDPAAYGLHTEALPPVALAMHNQSAWWLHTYYPADPPPGVYAISLTSLMGGIWIDQSEYAVFRSMRPDAIIGHSIYLYTIGSRGNPIGLSLSGLQIDQIDPQTYRQFGTNAVRPRWFDATSSLIAAPDHAWIAIDDQQPIAKEFAALFADAQPVTQAQTTDDHRSYKLYHFDLAARLQQAADHSLSTAFTSPQIYPDLTAAQAVSLPVKLGETAQLIGYQVITATNPLTLITYWRAGDQIIAPLQLFAHVIAPDGSIAAQEDRLDVPAYGWQSGDVFAQINHLEFSNAPGSNYWIEIGLYNPDSGQRVPITINGQTVDQRLLLQQIELK